MRGNHSDAKDCDTRDSDTELVDLLMFVDCIGGPDTAVTVACPSSILTDCDDDNDVDLGDFALFASHFSPVP